MSDDVQRALDGLPDDFRTAVVLCDVQGLSYKEIADIMQTPVGTVMSRLFRGRKLLAAALRDFAVAEGYVKPPDTKPPNTGEAGDSPGDTHGDPGASDETIDLGKYRAARTVREGSQS